MKHWRVLPALVVTGMIWFLWKGLTIEDTLASQKKIYFPTFSLQDVRHPEKTLQTQDLKGKVNIVHVWASWCQVCLQEHETWLHITRNWSYPLVGVIYRDDKEKVRKILKKKGDPYHYLLDDKSGNLGLDLGLLGTPETFILDKKGMVRFHQLGPIDIAYFESVFLPLIDKLNHE